MDWRDTGILLNTRRHGEHAAIVEVFTPTRGRHAGVVRGGASRRIAPILQPGAQLDVAWRARLEDHIGSFTVELQRARTTAAMNSRKALAGMNAVLALLGFVLPEREAHPKLYQRSEQLLDLLEGFDIWPLAYLNWEIALLDDMGYALDLTECAVTGATDGLAYISPKTGRAVTAAGAGEWADKLLELPPVMLGQGEASDAEVARALRVTGYFLEHRLAAEQSGKPLPPARGRFMDRLTR